MSIPDYQTIMLPLLEFASDGREHSAREAAVYLAGIFRLSEDEQNQLYPSGKKLVFLDRVEWAKTYLRQAGLFDSPRRTYFAITKRGRDVLAQKPPAINVKFLRQFAEFRAFEERTRASGKVTRQSAAGQSTGSPASMQTPKAAIEDNYKRLREALAQELIEVVKKQPPAFFERLVVELLVQMGYGGSIKDAGQAIGKSGDGGIDGIIKEDKLGLDIIYIQAKKWDGAVGRPEIQKFVGALAGQRARKGVFITTSTFTPDAKQYVSGIDSKIVLVDGEELAKLMIDHNVGVTRDSVYEIKRIDTDYFTDT